MTSAAVSLSEKEQALRSALRGCGSAVIAYSGGVDSAYLAKVALDVLSAERVLAVTGSSPSYPRAQRELAIQLAEAIGLPHLEIDTNEVADPDYRRNAADRCYFCKSELFERLGRIARERAYACVLDGANADDRLDYRPGATAARELGVRSPLQEAGLTKAEIRRLSREADLPTWELPASPCLASRIPYGIEVTPARLGQIEAAEAALRALRPWRALRVRHHGDLARLETAEEDLPSLGDRRLRETVAGALKGAGFQNACLDLQAYRQGSLNEALEWRGTAHASDRARVLEAERRLERAGIDARVVSADPAGDVAVIRPSEDSKVDLLSGRRARVLEACRGAGYRYVALELY